MSNNMAKIADARKTVEQLKLEVNIERMMVSEERRRVFWFSGTGVHDELCVPAGVQGRGGSDGLL